MNEHQVGAMPSHCPVCDGSLVVTRLQCPACGTEVTGNFGLSSLAGLREPYASIVELFLRVRGNLKEMERELGLSYPTVRARVEEALTMAGISRTPEGPSEGSLEAQRAVILDALERGEMSAMEATAQLRELKTRRST